jgi:hypothetical protein
MQLGLVGLGAHGREHGAAIAERRTQVRRTLLVSWKIPEKAGGPLTRQSNRLLQLKSSPQRCLRVSALERPHIRGKNAFCDAFQGWWSRRTTRDQRLSLLDFRTRRRDLYRNDVAGEDVRS